MALEKINGVLLIVSPPSLQQMEEDFALAHLAEPDPGNVMDRGPGGTCYYDDVIDDEVVAWCFVYARQHPEDEYIQQRVGDFQQMNLWHRQKHGADMPGYDATYFPEDAADQ
jgi:hypothetical protein